MTFKKSTFFSILICIVVTACNPTKHLPKGEVLYTGATVKVSGAGTVRQRKVLRSDLAALTRPKPNSKVLGIPIKLDIYNLFRNKKPKSFWGKLRDKYGEPPVLLSSVDLTYNTKVLQSYLENKGYFRAKVSGDTVVKRRRATAVYKAPAGDQYTINSIHFPTDSSQLTQAIIQSAKGSLLKVGKPFDLDVIKGERVRIDGFLKERGFYFFSPDDLLLDADSTIGNHKVNMYVTVKPETPAQAKDIYYINNVYIYTGFNLNAMSGDTSKANALNYGGYYIIDPKKRFKPKLFERIMMFDAGDVYNRTDHNLTLNRLINLNLFKFVKNRFQPVPSPDTPRLDAYYYLTPLPNKSIRAEITGTQKSNNLTGSEITLSWKNRNAFRGGEQVAFSTYVGSEVQGGGALQGYNTYRTGAELDFTIPRFVVPWPNHLNTREGFVPRTNIRLGYDILNRHKLYSLDQYRFSYGFIWKESVVKQHEFDPISINYVMPLNITKAYVDSTIKNPLFGKSTQRQFILGSTYQFNYNQLAGGNQPINAFYFNGLADVSGNLVGLLTGAPAKASKGDTVKFLNSAFAQYLKFETDGRYYRKVTLNSTWASRLILGFGLPYGNSAQLPFIKQFFVGGNNSLRGFRSRSVGPGIFHPADAAKSNFLPDLTGDIKLEFNTEFRQKLYGPLYGAAFIDAGNIWLYNKDSLQPGGQFTKDFYKQLAVDVGLGLRVDIKLFVVRLDVGVPVRKPWLQAPENRLLYGVKINNKEWRGANVVYNLAIGYPF